MPTPPPTTPHRTESGSIAPAYFERLYEGDPDPWAFETSPYEAAKYEATLDALPRARYASAFEVGCANGVLTERLADRCDRVLAVDVAEAALAQARRRCAGRGGVEIRRMAVPGEWPDERSAEVDRPFDLVLVSEVGYYLAPPDLDRLRARCAASVGRGGHLVLVHWTGETDYPLSGDDVHDAFLADPAWRPLRAGRTADYRLDVLERGEQGRAG
ncbi:SAM-dependent methyltransferase [Rubrivirga sp. S365]|uniref:SAM-dependent methyltransferase n=1 Tax=Rubrivirga litoralis TaxID=3075598 RepID=A0ABU3BQF4_9BACT|nr:MULTISPECIES: SAM-dependent methyltransferase [unclassified Rubrivirga]MDT0631490.1 SAM-dependent methyltransferase [Rubrivirga sp. F394]MDT7855527.1 SAM-dependent methyltransferase [Rubrivirga sp. S365]